MDKLNSIVVSNIKKMFETNFNLKKKEKCLILNDLPNENELADKSKLQINNMFQRTILGKEVYDVCKNFFTENVTFKTFLSTGMHGAEPPDEISNYMLKYDVIVILTTYSLSHTRARKNASTKGVRMASLPGFNREMFYSSGPMDVDYNIISEETNFIANLGNKTNRIKIEFPEGSEFSFNKSNRLFYCDDGLYSSPGSFGNLPAGEAFCAPIEGSAEGKLIVNKGWYPNLNEDMEIKVEKGLVQKIEGGGKVGIEFNSLLELDKKRESNIHRRNIAEFGIGTNPNAKSIEVILESEKIKGTVHIAIGDNINFGGNVSSDIHIDFVFPEINLWFDNKKVIENGNWLFEN
jgi:leucyl aminopeptidase (aminopeptidase T)